MTLGLSNLGPDFHRSHGNAADAPIETRADQVSTGVVGVIGGILKIPPMALKLYKKNK
jgi:hypothetical protein